MSTATVMLLPIDAGQFGGLGGLGGLDGLDGPGERGEFSEFVVRLGNGRPAHAVYVRRRLLVGLVVVGLLTVFGTTAHSVLADRGGVPASTHTVRPVTAALAAASSPPPIPAAAIGTQYIVQPGDTLWSLGELFHGSSGVADYVDALVAANGGGAALQVGQLLTLP